MQFRQPLGMRGKATAASGVIAVLLSFMTGLLAQEPVAETGPAKLIIDESPIVEAPITENNRLHWAFSPVTRSALPNVNDKEWPLTAVDCFILQKLEQKGLPHAREASRATLIRRLSFDFTGLPPTPEELAAFESDTSPDAYERLVDRLLASSAHGERWAQHWLDLARFAETDGFEHDKVRAEAWKYRDWVIAALNADLPYDEFVRLQVAGDRSENSIATQFCLSGPDMPDINDQAERRHNLLNEMTATVGSVFLGLQLACAQCHDHKYDPLSQADFYRLRAVFESAVPPLKRDAPYLQLASQKDVPAARFWIRGDHRRPGLEVPPAFPRIADTRAPGATAGLSSSANLRESLADWLVQKENPLPARVMANRLWQHHFGRGICDTPSDFGILGASPTHPELLDWLAVELRETGWSLKRLHRMIVCSATYRQSGIANCKLQIADLSSSSPKSIDPANSLYWHYPGRRLDGEAIHDSMLAAAGLLSVESGGPGVMPPLPAELVSTLLVGQWKASEREADHYRRSIYIFARRNLRYPIFEAFDRPDANASCAARNRSTTALQSLVMLNSEFTLLAARRLAGRVLQETSDPQQQVERLYLLTLSRRPTAEEQADFHAFLTKQQEQLKAEGRESHKLALPLPNSEAADPYAAAGLVDGCIALMNTSEFIYID